MFKNMTGFVGLVIAGVGLASCVQAQEKGRDYPVTVGKVTVPASKVPARETMLQPARQANKATKAKGEFVQMGKQQVWVPNGEPLPALPSAPHGVQIAASSATDLSATPAPKSRGRFEQRGKAIIWVENKDN
jgi:hypothetical protein